MLLFVYRTAFHSNLTLLLVFWQDTLWLGKSAQIFTSVASVNSSTITLRSFWPTSKMAVPCLQLIHQPSICLHPSQVKHRALFLIKLWCEESLFCPMIHSYACPYSRLHHWLYLWGDLPVLRHERRQKDPDQSTENAFQKTKTKPDF